MPLSPEQLAEIDTSLKEGERLVKDLEATISDAHISGLEVAFEESRLRQVKEDIRRLRMFYTRQKARQEAPTIVEE